LASANSASPRPTLQLRSSITHHRIKVFHHFCHTPLLREGTVTWRDWGVC
jgi:hypothetical protein